MLGLHFPNFMNQRYLGNQNCYIEAKELSRVENQFFGKFLKSLDCDQQENLSWGHVRSQKNRENWCRCFNGC